MTGLVLPAERESPAQVYFERYYGGFSGRRTFEPLTVTAGRGAVGRARVAVHDAAGRLVREFAVYGIGAYGAGANMAFRRDALLRRGGFDVALGTGTPARGGEDLAALVQLLWEGGTLGYEPAAVVHHRHRVELSELEHQLDGNGIGFTAMLTALVGHDPGHLIGLGAQLPRAARRLGAQSLTRFRGRGAHRTGSRDASDLSGPTEPDFPRDLVLTELRGMLRGPAAYLEQRPGGPGLDARRARRCPGRALRADRPGRRAPRRGTARRRRPRGGQPPAADHTGRLGAAPRHRPAADLHGRRRRSPLRPRGRLRARRLSTPAHDRVPRVHELGGPRRVPGAGDDRRRRRARPGGDDPDEPPRDR